MLTSTDTPVIFLAFANDAKHPLAKLENEYRDLTRALRKAEEGGLCEVHAEPFATRESIFDAFSNPRLKNRIAIFHFAGHAGASQLLFSDPVKDGRAAHISGLAMLFGRQPGLQLVFLNGCSTHPQVRALCDASVPAVIATSTAIVDETASRLSSRFYQCLANGESIASSFDAATADALSANGNGEIRDLYVEECPANDAFPWNLVYRPGAESVADWNLPEAANNPLFGLPPLPTYDLPQCPFLGLHWFGEEYSELFYGRGHQIRDLYTCITAKNSAPIVLFHGQSGVGKSSILSAGVRPRLDKRTYEVLYQRRNQATGLSGTLREALRASGGDVHLDGAWRALEMALERDVVVFLDQVEEVFTRPAERRPHELEEFFDQLAEVFSQPTNRPRGKLVLSFRKEWYAEIESQLTKRKLPVKSVLVDRLDRTGIIEAISAPLKNQRLITQYNLNIDDGLPNDIAADLLQDSSSPVAPLLQILLTEMWEEAYKHNSANPHFTADVYKKLKRKGIGDFLKDKLRELAGWDSEVVDSGLALDVLAFHTTQLGTAERRTPKDLEEKYSEQGQVVQALIQQCKSFYLLVDHQERTKEDSRDDAKMTSLGHDTLAPHIRKEFDESDRPGQRARRILENNASEWTNGHQGTLLNERDLSIVEHGQSGMRNWTKEERRLVKTSQAERTKQKFIRNGTWVLGLLSAIIIVTIGIIAWWKNAEALQQKTYNRIQDLRATAEFYLGKYPHRSLLVAIEAMKIALKTGTQISGAEDTLRNTLRHLASYGIGPMPRANNCEKCTFVSPDSRWMVTIGDDNNTAQLWDMSLQEPDKNGRLLNGHEGEVKLVVFSSDARWLLTSGGSDSTAHLWDLSAPDPAKSDHPLIGHTRDIHRGVFTEDARWLLIHGKNDDQLRIWDLTKSNPSKSEDVLGSEKNPITGFSIENNRWVAISEKGGTVIRLWDFKSVQSASKGLILDCHGSTVGDIEVSDDNRWAVATTMDNKVRVWDLNARDIEKSERILGEYSGPLGEVSFASNSRWVVIKSRGYQLQSLFDLASDHSPRPKSVGHAWAGLWDLTKASPAIPGGSLDDNKDQITHVSISGNGRWAVTEGRDNPVRIWDLNAAVPAKSARPLGNSESQSNEMFTNGDGRWVVTKGKDNLVRVWDLTAADPRLSDRILERKGNELARAYISPDNRWLITSGKGDPTARLWDLTLSNPSESKLVLNGHQGEFARAVFSSDNRWLITSGKGDPTARLWNLTLSNPSESKLVLNGHQGEFARAVFSSDNRWLVTSGKGDPTAQLWDLTLSDLSESTRVLNGHGSAIESITFSGRNHWLVTRGKDDTFARLWDLTLSEPAKGRYVLADHEPLSMPDMSYKFSSSYIVTGGERDTQLIKKWAPQVITKEDMISAMLSAPNGGVDRLFQRALSEILSHRYVTVSADSRWVLAVGGRANVAWLWDLTAPEPAQIRHALRGHKNAIQSVAISTDSHWAITTSPKDVTFLWDLKSPAPDGKRRQLGDGQNSITQAFFSADSRWVVTSHTDNSIHAWDLKASDITQSDQVLGSLDGEIKHLEISADSHWVVSNGTGETTAQVWDLTNANHKHLIDRLGDSKNQISKMLISPDSRWLVGAYRDKTVRKWDLQEKSSAQNWRVMGTIDDEIEEAGFTANSHWLATRGENLEDPVRLWDLTSLDTARTQINFNQVWFSPDSRWAIGTQILDTALQIVDLTAVDSEKNRIVLDDETQAQVEYIAVSPDSHWAVVVRSGVEYPRLLNLADLTKRAQRLGRIERPIRKVAFSADSRWMVALGAKNDTSVRLWDLKAGDLIQSERVVGTHDALITDAAISLDSRWVVTGGGDKTVRLWPLDSTELVNQASRHVGRNLSKVEWELFFPEENCHKIIPDLLDDQQGCSSIQSKGIWTYFSDQLANLLHTFRWPVKSNLPVSTPQSETVRKENLLPK